MMNAHKISTVVLIILVLIGAAGAVIVNIDGSNFVPLSWFNTNKTVWDGLPTNTTVNFHTGNASNITSGTLPKAVMPVNVSYNNTVVTNIYVYNTSNQVLSSGVDTKIHFNTVKTDSLNEYHTNSDSFNVSVTGDYLLSVKLYDIGCTLNDELGTDIYVNGVSVMRLGWTDCVTPTNEHGVTFTSRIHLNQSDYLQVYGLSTSGRTIYAGYRYSFLSIFRLGRGD